MKALRPYLPSLGMVLAATLAALWTAASDDKITATEGFMVASAMLGALTVYIVPRMTSVGWLKPVVAAATAGVSALGAAFISDGVSMQEAFTIAIQVLAGFGIVLGTNKYVPPVNDDVNGL